MIKRVAPTAHPRSRSTLASGESVGAIGGLGLLVASFLPWYSAGGESVTAWQAFSVVDLVMAAAAIAGLSVGLVVLTRLSVSYPIAGSAVSALLGLVALVLIVYRLIDPPGSGDVTRDVGAWIGLVSAATVSFGGYLGMQAPSGHQAAAL
jgi:hypothetical protein